MLKTGHYGAALLVYAPVGYLLAAADPALAAVIGAGAVALARVPDYDLRVPLLDHRGVTHTLLFLCAVVAVGSHLLADALTPSGVPLLWPLSDERYSVGLARASNPVANYGLLAAGAGAIAGVGYLVGLG